MMFKTELRVFYKLGETPLDKYIDSIIAIDINNQTIKEEDMFEKILERIEAMKVKKEAYVAELENLKATTDLEAIKNARFEQLKETIAKEVEDEFNEQLAEVELKIAHFDFVIAEDEEELDRLQKTEEEQPVENMEV